MGVALAQDVKKVEIEKISIPDKATHYYVMVKDAARGKAPNSGIKLEFSKAALTRVVSSKFDEKNAAVVIQVDEFYLEYRENELKEGSCNE